MNPTRARLARFSVDIMWTEDWPRAEGREVRGWYDSSSRCIAIYSGLPAPERAEIVAHELFHARFPKWTHRLINLLSRGLVTFVRRNRPLCEWFIESACTGRWEHR